MTDYLLKLDNVVKYFGRRLVFNGINYTFKPDGIYGISGPNGSGKSTLVKIIAGLISATKGKIIHQNKGKDLTDEELHNYIGFVSPYLILYDEFTAEENLIHFSKIRGINFDNERSDFLLNQFNIYERRNDIVRGYSSGMKQRLKYLFALLHKPPLIILDEPTSNLDNEGKEIVYKTIKEESKNSIVLVASNEDIDLQMCKEIIKIEDYKNKNRQL